MQFIPVMADGGLSAGALFVVVVVVVVVVSFLGWLLAQESYQVVLTASAGSMPQGKSVTVTATLQKKSWAFGSWNNVAGSFTVVFNAATAVLGPSPRSGATTAAAPTATINVVGTAAGTDNLRVTFTLPGSAGTATAGVPLAVIG